MPSRMTVHVHDNIIVHTVLISILAIVAVMATIESNLTKAAFLVKDTKMRAVVGVSCSLSILGSLLIILSYILFKKRRTRAREILLHLSLMDLGVALANLIGLSVYFDQYYHRRQLNPNFNTSYHMPSYIDGLCKTQAFFAEYCTISSILWTIALAGFLYFLIIHNKSRISIYFYWFSHIVCYVLPFLLSLWLVLTGKLGYSPFDSSGWCTLITRDLERLETDSIFIAIFGYDLWVYLAVVTIPILYASIRCYLTNRLKEVKNDIDITPKKFWSSLHHVDYKFVIIPVVFVFLRIWSGIMSILYRYETAWSPPYELNLALLYLSGIGDSSQGFANAIIFVIFTKSIRDSFIKFICCGRRPSDKNDDNIDGNCEDRIQDYSCESAHLAAIGEPVKPREAELSASEEASLVFSSIGSNKNHKLEHSGQYGAVN